MSSFFSCQLETLHSSHVSSIPLPSFQHSVKIYSINHHIHYNNKTYIHISKKIITQTNKVLTTYLSMAGVGSDPDEFRIVCPPVNKEDGRLTRKYTDEGQGAKSRMSPPIEWYNVPEGTKSMALVVEDIDAPDPSEPVVPWTIWVVAHIPPTLKGLPEGFSGKQQELGKEYADIAEGNNDDKVPGWRVPTMPSHGHRIEFKLYALDDEINFGKTVTKEKVLDTIEGHVIGEAAMIAIF